MSAVHPRLAAPVRVLLLLAAWLALAAGCTRLQYTRATPSAAAEDEPLVMTHDFKSATGKPIPLHHDLDLETDEFLLSDDTGGGCAALMTQLERSGNAYEAAYRAARKGPVIGPVEYSYRLYHPAEFRGTACGAYYKEIAGKGTVRGAQWNAQKVMTQIERPATVDGWELGLYVGGAEGLIEDWYWLRYSIDFRFGVGKLEVDQGQTGGMEQFHFGDTYVTAPLHFGVQIFPEFLYGLGVAASAGADPLSWLSKEGSWLEKYDLTVRAEYAYGFEVLALGVYGGWQRRHVDWGDIWVDSTGPFAGAFLQLHLNKLL